jgi:3-oxoacyl-[acyl-carrier protein] reductase
VLEDKVAIVVGGSGAVGSTIAKKLAAAGASVILSARAEEQLRTTAEAIRADGGKAEYVTADATDATAVAALFDEVVQRYGGVDIVVNAISSDAGEQGVPLLEMSEDEFMTPVDICVRAAYLLARAAAEPLAARGGVLLTLSVPMARMPAGLSGVFGPIYAMIEAVSRQLADELGPQGVRAVCIRPTGMPESVTMGSNTRDVWGKAAAKLGVSLDQLLEQIGAGTLRQRPLEVAEVADVAVFLASDRASGINGTTINVSAGAVWD